MLLILLLYLTHYFDLNKLKITKQIELSPPEKQSKILDFGFTFMLLYNASLALYGIFFSKHSLHIGSFLCMSTELFCLHFLQGAPFFIFSSLFTSFLTFLDPQTYF